MVSPDATCMVQLATCFGVSEHVFQGPSLSLSELKSHAYVGFTFFNLFVFV